MSVQSEINRISSNVTAALAAIADKGVTVPDGSNSDSLASLIAAIEAGGGGVPIYIKNITFAEDMTSTYEVDISDISFNPEGRKTSWVIFKNGRDMSGLHVSVQFTCYYEPTLTSVVSASSGRSLTGTTTGYSYGMLNEPDTSSKPLTLKFTGSRPFCAKAGSEYTIVGIKLIE